jgi:mono/diheme cytochrome c family protein
MVATKQPDEFDARWRRIAALTLSAAAAALIAGVGFMPAEAQTPAATTGEAVFDHWCAPCHDPGPGHPGTQGLQIKYRGTEIPAPLEERTDLTPPVVRTFVRQGVLAMAPFRKTEITDAELVALAAYLSRSPD